ncbi:glycosyltransferase family 2 protein [Salinimicrobium sp. CAU 1759]
MFKNKRPLVSVAMITYGHEKYIRQAVESVLMQVCDFEVELIISNDNSPDATDKKIKEIINTHPNASWIKYTRHEENKGMMLNSLWTINQCLGKYIALCEGDDYWTDPLKIQKQIKFMESVPELVFTFHGSKTLHKGNFSTYYKSEYFIDKQIIEKKHFIQRGGGSYSTSSAIFRRDILLDGMPDYVLHSKVGDFPLALLAISKGEIGYLEDEMSVYRNFTEFSWSLNVNNFRAKKINLLNKKEVLEMFNISTQNEFAEEVKLLNKNINLGLFVAHNRKIINLTKKISPSNLKKFLMDLYFRI